MANNPENGLTGFDNPPAPGFPWLRKTTRATTNELNPFGARGIPGRTHVISTGRRKTHRAAILGAEHTG